MSAAAQVERRFTPASGRQSQLGLVLAGLGSAGLGAAVYGLWLAPRAVPGSGWILLGALLGLGLASLARSRRPPAVRVGALGVTLEQPGGEAQRLGWFEMQRIHMSDGELRLEAGSGVTRLPLPAHGQAAARILAEAARRIGRRLDISPRAQERLPALSDAEGDVVPAGRWQLAGRKCLASAQSITFESDARLCDNCAALYHREHLPAECTSCGQSLSGASVALPKAAG